MNDDLILAKRLRDTPLYEASGEESDMPERAADTIERLTRERDEAREE